MCYIQNQGVINVCRMITMIMMVKHGIKILILLENELLVSFLSKVLFQKYYLGRFSSLKKPFQS